MRKITYFENMRGHLNNVTREELEAFRAYDTARKYNLEYPILNDMMFSHAGRVGEIFTSAHVGKFIFATASTNAVDNIAQFFSYGYKVLDIVSIEKLLGDNNYITCCKFGLVMGRR